MRLLQRGNPFQSERERGGRVSGGPRQRMFVMRYDGRDRVPHARSGENELHK